jgi:outer membrane protein assembly factor BamB
MSGFYGTLRENPARAPQACVLEAPLREIWNAPAPFASGVPLLAAGELLFVTDGNRHIVALDVESQERAWRYPWPSNFPAMLHEGHVFAWTAERDLHVIEASTGRPQRSIPALRADQALAVGNRMVAYAPDYDYGGHRLYAVDWMTGSRLWSEALGRDLRIDAPMTASGDTLVYALSDHGPSPPVTALIARRLDSGAELWRKPETGVSGLPSIRDDRVVVSTGLRLVAFQRIDGSVLWEAECGGAVAYLYGDHVYTLNGWEGRYRVFELASGKQVRSWDLRARIPSSLLRGMLTQIFLVSETHVFIGSDRGTLFAFTRDTGKYVWNHQPKNAVIRTEAACIDGRLYYQNGPNRLFCLGPRS